MNDPEADARQQIHDSLCWYCRGIDRLDADAVRRGFHPGAMLIDYAPAPVRIEDFAVAALDSLRSKYRATQHRIGNILVAFDGDDVTSGAATVETYIMAFHVSPANLDANPDANLDDGTVEQLHTFNGRWIDRFTLADGHWRSSERTLRNDWTTVVPIDARMAGNWPASGRDGTPDPFDDRSGSVGRPDDA